MTSIDTLSRIRTHHTQEHSHVFANWIHLFREWEGVIIFSITTPAVPFGTGSRWLADGAKVKRLYWSTAAAVLVVLGGVGVKLYDDAASAESPLAATNSLSQLESIAWPGGADPLPLTTQSSVTEAAPVASLLVGLESRLAKQPNDAKGWALLSQSHAFMGNIESAEAALLRAVELGFDEPTLRQRVKLAKREQQSINWIESAVGG